MANRTRRIIPSVLTRYAPTAQKRINVFRRFTSHLHLDLMDGDYVMTRSFGPSGIVKLNLPKYTAAHLMVEHPAAWAGACYEAGIRRLVIHVEAKISPPLIRELRRRFEVFLALRPGVAVALLKPYKNICDGYHVMTIVPGRQGNVFLPRQLKVIRQVRKMYPRSVISVDGGMSQETIGPTLQSGADWIIVGSILRDSAHPAFGFKQLQALL
ncbi:MAG: hypothetical protein Q8Q20_01230 [bacterium]|nr:hypothetical protein [bacterium]